jgi:hypothetical protein
VKGNKSWRIIVFALYTIAAFVSVVCFYYTILPLNERQGTIQEIIYSNLDTVEFDSTANPLEESTTLNNNIDFNTNTENSTTEAIMIQKNYDLNVLYTDVFCVINALLTIPKLQLLIPFQICFGLSASFVDTYVCGVIIHSYIGDGYIGVLSASNTVTAVLLAVPYAYFSNSIKHGKSIIMVFGCLFFAWTALPMLFFSDEFISQWSFIVFYFVVHGAARGAWENTNKSVVIDYFNDDDENTNNNNNNSLVKQRNGKMRDIAFAAIYFSSGLAGAFGFLFFKFMTRNQLAVFNVAISFISLISFLLSYKIHLKQIIKN